MNDSITITQLSKPDMRMLIREELEFFFAERVERNAGDDEIGGIALAMEITGLAKPTIYSHVSNRTIPHMKRGKKLYFSRTELNAWIDAGRRKTRAETTNDAENYSRTRSVL